MIFSHRFTNKDYRFLSLVDVYTGNIRVENERNCLEDINDCLRTFCFPPSKTIKYIPSIVHELINQLTDVMKQRLRMITEKESFYICFTDGIELKHRRNILKSFELYFRISLELNAADFTHRMNKNTSHIFAMGVFLSEGNLKIFKKKDNITFLDRIDVFTAEETDDVEADLKLCMERDWFPNKNLQKKAPESFISFLKNEINFLKRENFLMKGIQYKHVCISKWGILYLFELYFRVKFEAQVIINNAHLLRKANHVKKMHNFLRI